MLFLVRCADRAAGRWSTCAAGARSAREADLVGALLLAVALAGVILAFATADPRGRRSSPTRASGTSSAPPSPPSRSSSHLRRAEAPLVPRGALRRTPAWGSLLVSFFVGAALIAALIDIPIFARTTIYADSQLMAALVLVRFLVALPGRRGRRRLPHPHACRAGVVTAVGMALRGGRLRADERAGASRPSSDASSNVPLVLCGFGFGLALAPVNAAVLARTDDDVHGLATAWSWSPGWSACWSASRR